MPYIAVYCRILPYIIIYYRILLYITLIRNRSLLTKSVEIGGRAGGVTGVSRNIGRRIGGVTEVSRNSTPPLNLSFCEIGL